MGTVTTCPCGTILSRHNTDPDRLCAACRRRVEDEREATADPATLERLVAGILLTNDALQPGEPANVGLELAVLGIEADSWAVGHAVRRLRARYGIMAVGERGRAGYRVKDWECRYRGRKEET